MSPQERKPRWRRIVLVLGIALVAPRGRRRGLRRDPAGRRRLQPGRRVPRGAVRHAGARGRARRAGGKKTDPVDRFIWAHYGYTRDRRRYLPLKKPPRPPFREIWQYQGNVLLEFPPVIGGKRLYLLNDHGVLYGDRQAHRPGAAGSRKLGALAAASPAYAGGVGLRRPAAAHAQGRGSRAGRVVALDGKSGQDRAGAGSSRAAASPRRWSPTGACTSARRTAPSTRWTPTTAPCAGASRPAARSRAGSRWPTAGSTSATTAAACTRSARATAAWSGARRRAAARFGLGAGNFYSTPAVAYGRVYMGNTDGRVYSFSAAGGKLAWSHSTGGYVYASPAVAPVPGGRPLVYVGSYSGRFYALDARTRRRALVARRQRQDLRRRDA